MVYSVLYVPFKKKASQLHPDLKHAPYNVYGVKYMGPVALMTHRLGTSASQPHLDLHHDLIHKAY